MKVLIVEDNLGMQRMLKRTLDKHGYESDTTSNGETAIELIQTGNYSAVISDLRLPGTDGLSVLRAAKRIDERTITIIITAYGSIETAVQAMKDGADDFITKPFDTNLLLIQLQKGVKRYEIMTENTLLREVKEPLSDLTNIIGQSDAFQAVMKQIHQVGPIDSAVLLLGESGTGKEILAKAVHALSPRNKKHFVAINCAAIPHDLLENELFGHEKGAFTGADRRKPGKLELANGGTVFLDEIGDMDPVLQAKLLRFLQEKEFERVGGNVTLSVNVRVVAATNRKLRELVQKGRFREDLFYRLSVFPIEIPPLRQRRKDIPLLVDHFLAHYAREFNKPNLKLGTSTIDHLIEYDWPGNVRELQNCIERAAILASESVVKPEHIAIMSLEDCQSIDLEDFSLKGSLQEVVNKARSVIETRMIQTTLEKNGWNRSNTAKDLGVNYKTLLNKIKEYQIE